MPSILTPEQLPQHHRTMSQAIITLTTDFGTGSPYVAQMKGVILSINPQATLVDLTHDIPPQDIRGGALALAETTTRFPAASIHIAVVDPGVGTERRIVAAEIDGRYYIAPDNGLLSLLVQQALATQIVELTERRFWLPEIFNTFHGRDIMAPVAAQLSLGVPFRDFGPISAELVALDWPAAQIEPGEVHGEIIAVDSFGNLITNITREDLAAIGDPDQAKITCGNRQIIGLIGTYGQRPAGSVVALLGSSGRLEIAVVQGTAHGNLGVEIRQRVSVRWDAGLP